MVQMRATVRNQDGIHCRPAAVIAQRGQTYAGCATARTCEREADLRSVMEILSLGLLPDESVTVEVEGPDEQSVCAEFVRLFETEFNFRPGDPLAMSAVRPARRTAATPGAPEAVPNAPDPSGPYAPSGQGDLGFARRRRRLPRS